MRRLTERPQPEGIKDLKFRSSSLGNYFAKRLWPAEKLNTMSTFNSMNPSNSGFRPEVLDEFEKQLHAWLLFLEEAGSYNWTQIRTSISISNRIKLRLGDTHRVVLYHNERHLRPAKRAITKN